MELQNLPSKTDRKQLCESGFLSLLVHILHEPTIATLDHNNQTIEQFTAEFYSLPRSEKRRNCTRLLRSVIQSDPLPEKNKLETLEVLESLRSVVECLYGEHSRESISRILFGRMLAPLQEILYRGFYFREGFNTFERLGGAFALLDILFFDFRFGEILDGEGFSIQEQNKDWNVLRRVSIQLIERLIYHVDSVRQMFLDNQSLLDALTVNYENEQNILTRNSIVASFKRLASLPGGVDACADHHIVELLTTNAVKCHLAGDRKEELVSHLEVLSVLTKSDQSRLDFLSTSGSMDMLLDLLNPHRKYSTFILNNHVSKLVDYRIYRAMNLYSWLCNVRCLSHTFGALLQLIGGKLSETQLVPEVLSAKVEVPEIVRNSCRRVKQMVIPMIFYYLAILRLFYDKTERWRQDRKCRNIRGCLILVCILIYGIYFKHFIIHPIGIYITLIIFNYFLTDYPLAMTLKFGNQIFENIFPKLYDDPRALERFRERDGCALLVDLLKYIPDMKSQAFRAICRLAQPQNKPGNQVEKRRLRELGAYEALKDLQKELKEQNRWNWVVYVAQALYDLRDDVD